MADATPVIAGMICVFLFVVIPFMFLYKQTDPEKNLWPDRDG
jgi:hypothetical protein